MFQVFHLATVNYVFSFVHFVNCFIVGTITISRECFKFSDVIIGISTRKYWKNEEKNNKYRLCSLQHWHENADNVILSISHNLKMQGNKVFDGEPHKIDRHTHKLKNSVTSVVSLANVDCVHQTSNYYYSRDAADDQHRIYIDRLYYLK